MTGWTRAALNTPPLSGPQGSTEVLRDLVLGRPCADRISQLPLRDKPPSNPAVSCDERRRLSLGPRIGRAVRRPASDGLGWTHPHVPRQLAGRPGAGRSREASLACPMAGWLAACRATRASGRASPPLASQLVHVLGQRPPAVQAHNCPPVTAGVFYWLKQIQDRRRVEGRGTDFTSRWERLPPEVRSRRKAVRGVSATVPPQEPTRGAQRGSWPRRRGDSTVFRKRLGFRLRSGFHTFP